MIDQMKVIDVGLYFYVYLLLFASMLFVSATSTRDREFFY